MTSRLADARPTPATCVAENSASGPTLLVAEPHEPSQCQSACILPPFEDANAVGKCLSFSYASTGLCSSGSQPPIRLPRENPQSCRCGDFLLLFVSEDRETGVVEWLTGTVVTDLTAHPGAYMLYVTEVSNENASSLVSVRICTPSSPKAVAISTGINLTEIASDSPAPDSELWRLVQLEGLTWEAVQMARQLFMRDLPLLVPQVGHRGNQPLCRGTRAPSQPMCRMSSTRRLRADACLLLAAARVNNACRRRHSDARAATAHVAREPHDLQAWRFHSPLCLCC